MHNYNSQLHCWASNGCTKQQVSTTSPVRSNISIALRPSTLAGHAVSRRTMHISVHLSLLKVSASQLRLHLYMFRANREFAQTICANLGLHCANPDFQVCRWLLKSGTGRNTGGTFRVLLKPGTAGRNSELDCVLKLNHGTHLKLAARYVCTCCLPAP